MSSSLEVQSKYGEGNRFGEEAQGLVESGTLPTTTTAAQAKLVYQDEEGILPVILEDYLERAGVM